MKQKRGEDLDARTAQRGTKMATRIYDLERHKSRTRERDELHALIREITPAAKTIAEELKKHSIMRTARIIARNQRRTAKPD